jgi:peptidoglycan/LPS O-acetylase OafA/YrhL
VNRGRSLSIDALRGFAALSVVLCHAHMVQDFGVPAYDAFMGFFGKVGGHGVELFFVLSGFCIHWGYSDPKRTFDAGQYLKRRWFRIYPPYFFALFFSLALAMAGLWLKSRVGEPLPMDNFGPLQVLSHLFLVHNWFDRTMYAVNGPFWTIALEAQFYLLYLLVRRYFFRAQGWFFVFFTASVLHVLAWRMDPWNGFQPTTAFRYWLQWLMGAWLASSYRGYEKKIASLQGVFWAIFFFLFIPADGLSHQDAGVLSAPFLGVVFVCLVAACLSIPQKRWQNPIMALLPAAGIFSYSTYLLHYPILDRWNHVVSARFPEGVARVIVSLLGIASCLILAYFFFLLFERPYLKKKEPVVNEFP